ncbi:hypothetical protein LHK95_24005, partial [Escherichia coli]|nr:hypothetical protein [Escherichia coli]
MADFPRASNGRYQTEGLSAREFERLFNQIEKDKRSKRRAARRTLTPFSLKNKTAEDIISLGKKKKGGVDSIGQRNSYVKTWGCGGFLNETNIYSRGK